MVVVVFGGGVVKVYSTHFLFLRSLKKYQKFFAETPATKKPQQHCQGFKSLRDFNSTVT
jgi:hypothetical protein